MLSVERGLVCRSHHPASLCICSCPWSVAGAAWSWLYVPRHGHSLSITALTRVWSAPKCDGQKPSQRQVMVRNCILSPERFVSSEWRYGVCFGKLWLRFFVPWELKSFPSPSQEALAAVMLWLYGLLLSHYLTFQSGERSFRPLKAAVNRSHWLQNQDSQGLWSHITPPPPTLLFEIYQTLHLFT